MLPADYFPAHTLFPSYAGGGDAPVVVIGSSIGTTSLLWEREIEALRQFYRVLTYEHPGHGTAVALTPASAPTPAGPYTAEALAAAVIRLLDRYQIQRAHVVGLSLAGVIGQSMALLASGRLTSLTIVGSAAVLPPRSLWVDRAAAVRAAGTVATEAVSANLPERWLSAPFRQQHPETAAGLLAGLAEIDAEGYAGCCEALADFDATERLGEITVPTLIVAGEVDPVTPAAASHVLRDGILGSRLEVVPTSHLAPLEMDLSPLLVAHIDGASAAGG
jgi:3-oxoadipate enol-lactonase